MRIPESLREGVISWMADGQAWADSLPALLEQSRERWGLSVGEPFEGGFTAWVAPVERDGGSACVLKLRYPAEDSRFEADGLLLWDGNGAVRLIEHDEATHALLLERLLPGSTLFDLGDPDEALEVACGVLRRLWVPSEPAHPFETAHARAIGQCEDVVRRYRTWAEPFDVALLNAAVAAFGQLAAYDGGCVVLHQDFHRGNVLRAQREPWLAIDPKPLAGERAFDAHWLLRDLVYSEPRSTLPVPRLLERLAAELSLDAERVRLWTIARTVENTLWRDEVDDIAAADNDLPLAAALL